MIADQLSLDKPNRTSCGTPVTSGFSGLIWLHLMV